MSIDRAVNKQNESTSGLRTHSVTYSSDVQDPKSASGMNFLFIGVSKVTLSNKAKEHQCEQQQQQQQQRDRREGLRLGRDSQRGHAVLNMQVFSTNFTWPSRKTTHIHRLATEANAKHVSVGVADGDQLWLVGKSNQRESRSWILPPERYFSFSGWECKKQNKTRKNRIWLLQTPPIYCCSANASICKIFKMHHLFQHEPAISWRMHPHSHSRTYGSIATAAAPEGIPLFSVARLWHSWWTAALAMPYPTIPVGKMDVRPFVTIFYSLTAFFWLQLSLTSASGNILCLPP